MKKLIALLLAVSAMSLSASAFAAAEPTGLTGMTVAGNNTLKADKADQTAYPCYKNGTTLKFTISGLTGSQLTLISYKDGTTPSDSTIQYIDQYTVTGGSQVVEYKIREQADGIYCLKFNDDGVGVADYFYKVGNPTVEMATFDGHDSNTNVTAENGKISFVAVAKRADGVSFAESANNCVVTLTAVDGATTKTAAKEIAPSYLDGLADADEIEGSATVYISFDVIDVPTGATVSATPSFN